jgi:hydrogenase maturation protease
VRTIVIGLGNPILGDDGVGWLIAHEVEQNKNILPDVTIECQSVGGISLMEALIGYDRAVIIDAIVSGNYPVGTVNQFALADLSNLMSGHTSSAHDTSLQNALQIGHLLGAYLPDEISIVTVEAQNIYEFSQDLTPAVAAAVPKAVTLIRDLLIESTPVKNPGIKNLNSYGDISMVSPEILRFYPFFGDLPDTTVKSIAMISEEKTFEKGAVICEEGQPAIALYLLREGGVSLYYKSEEEYHSTGRKDFLVGEINPGEIFAISAMIEPYKYSATVKAEQNCMVVRIDADGLHKLVIKDAGLYCVLMRKIAQLLMERLAFARVQLAAAWAK